MWRWFRHGRVQNDAVALVDAIAPPDHILFSPIGRSNGEAYKNLFTAIVSTPGGTSSATARLPDRHAMPCLTP